MRFSGFGAVGIRGNTCAVPAPDGFLGSYTVKAHDEWCDCMYGSDAALNAQCKTKFAIGKSANLIGMPWTDTVPACGKAARGLPGASGACVQAAGLIDQAIEAIRQGGEQLLQGALNPEDPNYVHPAQPVMQPGGGRVAGRSLQIAMHVANQTSLTPYTDAARQAAADAAALAEYLRRQAMAKTEVPILGIVAAGALGLYLYSRRNR